MPYYLLTPKGRRYLKKHRFTAVLEIFLPSDSTRLASSRADHESAGWYSIRHVGEVDQSLIDKGYYEMRITKRLVNNIKEYRLTSSGKKRAKRRMRDQMNRELRAEAKARRAEATEGLNRRLKDPGELVRA